MFDMILVSSSLGNLVVLLGTYLFDRYENWGYFDSFYYVSINRFKQFKYQMTEIIFM